MRMVGGRCVCVSLCGVGDGEEGNYNGMIRMMSHGLEADLGRNGVL